MTSGHGYHRFSQQCSTCQAVGKWGYQWYVIPGGPAPHHPSGSRSTCNYVRFTVPCMHCPLESTPLRLYSNIKGLYKPRSISHHWPQPKLLAKHYYGHFKFNRPRLGQISNNASFIKSLVSIKQIKYKVWFKAYINKQQKTDKSIAITRSISLQGCFHSQSWHLPG